MAFFSSKEKQEALLKEMKKWKTTPFKHRTGVLKVGVDCFHFMINVYGAVGALKGDLKKIPYYGHDWALHTDNQRFYKWAKSRPELVQVPFKSIMNGDLILYQFGRAASHCGIFFDPNVYQVLSGSGVHITNFYTTAWTRRVKYLFRVK